MHALHAVIFVIYGVLAAAVIRRLRTRGTAAFRRPFTPKKRQLVGATTLYLIAPLVILCTQLFQLIAVAGAGDHFASFETFVFWGSIRPSDAASISTVARVAIAGFGLLFPASIAIAMLVWTKRSPKGAAFNFVRVELGRVLIILTFGLSPLVSLVLERGDYWNIREALSAHTQQAGDVALLILGLMSACAFFLWRKTNQLQAIATPEYDAINYARERLNADRTNPLRWRQLGAALLRVGSPEALESLRCATTMAPRDAHSQYLFGQALLADGQTEDAETRFCNAGRLLQKGTNPVLLHEVTLALANARVVLEDVEGALITAETAHEQSPNDPRGIMVYADALVLNGRVREARNWLETRINRVDEKFAAKIRERIESMSLDS